MYGISDVKKYITGINWKSVLKEVSETNKYLLHKSKKDER